jgi:tryptophan halogenase
MRKKKIAIIGAGNAGLVTALHYHFHGVLEQNIFDKIDIYYDPNTPIERVGQGSLLPLPTLISKIIDTNCYDNKINSTLKTGILYENWGKKNHKFFHMFPLGSAGIHYQPNLLSKAILESGNFNVIEKSVSDFSEIDADYIFDCRGKSLNNWDDYETLINPLNSALLCRKSGKDPDLIYTRCVATPDGWCFVIPNPDSVSFGYLYNDTITEKNDATHNFKNIFDCEVDFSLSFKNYVAKNFWLDDRVILNGNRYCFIEPLEATSTGLYQRVAAHAWDTIVFGVDKKHANDRLMEEVKKTETFILWHYQSGSKYNTPFWDYAKTLKFDPDEEFVNRLKLSKQYSLTELIRLVLDEYVFWPEFSFKVWDDNV